MKTVELAFEELGSSNDRPLIILHGFFASSRNWRQVADRLSDKFHVYVPDMRNHGVSPHDPLMDYPSMTADLKSFIDQRGMKKVNLLGHSMGGKIAMWFALNYPECVDKLVVVDIAPVSYKHSFDPLIQALKSLPLNEISNRKQAEAMLAADIPELSYRQFLLQNLVLNHGEYRWRIDLDIFYRMAPNIVAFPDAGTLAPFAGKALFIAGADSNYVKSEDIATLFPKATPNVIANAGHWVHVQQPDIFVEQVVNFLSD
ncbi:alpha/beta fold hydrolase [Methylobacter sp. BlB1]|uniref:alpha/beta fold hydrolase n=1 Tax=Methylobacter sp. BlB1 TaxID=2785914 RepID=UPI00189331A2|nr:alpha/beta fold hydrolase [Methylobacter sp. BlB1]MBF6649069.1 alpha/beta fold hydrolase [Methylobacter sp. BlB1]